MPKVINLIRSRGLTWASTKKLKLKIRTASLTQQICFMGLKLIIAHLLHHRRVGNSRAHRRYRRNRGLHFRKPRNPKRYAYLGLEMELKGSQYVINLHLLPTFKLTPSTTLSLQDQSVNGIPSRISNKQHQESRQKTFENHTTGLRATIFHRRRVGNHWTNQRFSRRSGVSTPKTQRPTFAQNLASTSSTWHLIKLPVYV